MRIAVTETKIVVTFDELERMGSDELRSLRIKMFNSFSSQTDEIVKLQLNPGDYQVNYEIIKRIREITLIQLSQIDREIAARGAELGEGGILL